MQRLAPILPVLVVLGVVFLTLRAAITPPGAKLPELHEPVETFVDAISAVDEQLQHDWKGMNDKRSPEYLRMSLAAAMTLGFKPGLFYRNAKLYCINLLLTYRSGCAGRARRPGARRGARSSRRTCRAAS